MYVRDLVASRCRPIKELKGYEKVWLEPGESKTVKIPLVAEELAFADENCEMIVEPGKFKLWIAHDSADDALETSFTVK
jgi:beta-glucosidase